VAAAMARNDPDSSVSPTWRLDVLVLDLHEGEGRGGGGTMEAGQAIWYHLTLPRRSYCRST
jgi:hypothetical protein